MRDRGAVARAGRERSTLLRTSSIGMSSRRSRRAPTWTASIVSRSRSSGRDASATCKTRSATSVSSSVAANPSTSCVGRRRMKPTVSVTRYRLPSCSNAACRRIERLEQAVVDRCVRAGQRIQERRLPDVRVPGERDRRSGRPPALLATRCALAASSVRSRRLRSETRVRASRRSLSSWLSPGPLVPTPPPSRSRCCHIPRMRGRLYSSCASSTWSFPSALARMLGEDVEDQLCPVDDARLERVLERSLLRRVSSSSTSSTSADASP